ncbi:outer membrane beta-barrel protein [Thermodesulfobacteriota bacterium]
MKKVLLVLLLVLCMPLVAYAEGGFIGVGVSYGIDEFDIDDTAIAPFSVDADDTYGVHLNAGYRWNQLAIGLEFEYLPGWEYAETQVITGIPVTLEIDGELSTIMGFVQFFPMPGTIEPYLKAGAGWMNGEIDMSFNVAGFPVVGSGDESDLCLGAGAGIDFHVTDVVALGLSGNYTLGLNDMDNMRYWSLRAGATFYFP